MITGIPHYNGKDLLDRYIQPIIISAIIVIGYAIVRYNKIGMGKVILEIVGWSIVAELLYVCVVSLARIPISFYTIPLAIIVEILLLTGLMNSFEKALENKKNSNKVSSKESEATEE